MPELRTADGVRLVWEQQGSGPPVVLVPYYGVHPTVFEPIRRELAGDHRLISFDDRGTGRSERVGPYDIETSSADLAAVCEAADAGGAVALCLVDASNRAARVAARQPELIRDVLCVGSAPLARSAFASSEAMISSSTVVDAFRRMMDTDFRAALRAMMSDVAAELSEEEVRERVRIQVEFSPQEALVGRMNAWAEDDDGLAFAREIGSRLRVLLSPGAGGSWFPDVEELREVIVRELPEARISTVSDGIVSAPAETAAVVRELVRERQFDRSA